MLIVTSLNLIRVAADAATTAVVVDALRCRCDDVNASNYDQHIALMIRIDLS
jgi:hypothetical protein